MQPLSLFSGCALPLGGSIGASLASTRSATAAEDGPAAALHAQGCPVEGGATHSGRLTRAMDVPSSPHTSTESFSADPFGVFGPSPSVALACAGDGRAPVVALGAATTEDGDAASETDGRTPEAQRPFINLMGESDEDEVGAPEPTDAMVAVGPVHVLLDVNDCVPQPRPVDSVAAEARSAAEAAKPNDDTADAEDDSASSFEQDEYGASDHPRRKNAGELYLERSAASHFCDSPPPSPLGQASMGDAAEDEEQEEFVFEESAEIADDEFDEDFEDDVTEAFEPGGDDDDDDDFGGKPKAAPEAAASKASLGNFPAASDSSVVKGAWSAKEDALLLKVIEANGARKWGVLASHLPGRTSKQCRERWFNQLSPDVSKSPWTEDEDRVIVRECAKVGPRWAYISAFLEGRTDNAVKNRWNCSKGDAVVIANLSRFTEFDLNPETTPRLVKRVARYAA